jgi:2-oxoglutarate ferredoxin oxidoreductase subunit delta
MRILTTNFICPTGRKCEACWNCINVCPQAVLGKVGFLWHKHVIIVSPEQCIGCLACVKACKYGVITAINKRKHE